MNKKCPKCGSPLVRRIGFNRRTGEFFPFYGCSNYPKCKYVENIKNPKANALEVMIEILERIDTKIEELIRLIKERYDTR